MDGPTVPREDFGLYLDMESAMKRLGGNRTVYNTLLKKFLAGNDEEKLISALAAGDLAAATAAAHNIKGVAGNLSLSALSKAGTALLEALRAGEDPGGLPQAVYETGAKTVFVIETVLAES